MRDDLPFTYRPIDRWPGELTSERRDSLFDSGWGTTLKLLLRELKLLDATPSLVVCQVALRERDFRADGSPRSRAVAQHPGVILAFESKHGPLKYWCDTFTGFDDNVRAIALGLEALRKIERYGIANRGEQYTGWSALGAGTPMGETMTRDEAHRVLVDLAGRDFEDSDDVAVRAAFKLASKRAHPDQGGSEAQMQAAVDARDRLLADG